MFPNFLWGTITLDSKKPCRQEITFINSLTLFDLFLITTRYHLVNVFVSKCCLDVIVSISLRILPPGITGYA